MSVTAIITAAIVVGCVGILIGFFLGIAGEKFKVEVDEREEAILGVLPGNNCGGCGYAGCSGLAAAIVKGAGNCGKANRDYEYTGVEDCAAMAFVPNGGPKSCNYGCLGYGSCVKACPFDAIHIVDGIAKVDKEVCKACGKCVAACPKHLIELVPYDAKHLVQCSSKDKGKDVMSVCKAGCIGCGLCVRQCEFGAVTLENNLATIDPLKCQGCGKCAEKCPKKVIA